MGTNYYTKTNICNHCGRFDDVHIGKSSYGWAFLFNYNGGKYYSNRKELEDFLRDKKIIDEYGAETPHEKFWEWIEEKQKSKGNEGAINIGGYYFLDKEFC